ncbi:GntR family transcriptional regulator [Shouchella shacheensis]|uniref:GntR family transcriptional regulator n=1 Tax=Shouchella shacheensis TaxID=1649580 RepID=UPI00073FFF38|nr:GntR family transcriptional regulator [Shouchella shacheensis]
MANPNTKRINHYSTRDFVYETVRARIMDLKLLPGSSISEKEIAEELEVSRTPVREAFLKLSQDDLLEIRPQKGSFVTFIDLDHVEDARFIREHLEVGAVRLACETMQESVLEDLEVNLAMQQAMKQAKKEEQMFELDQEFHRLIALGCKKERVWEVVQQMNSHLKRLLKLSLVSHYNWETLVLHHQDIFEAVKAKDAERAEAIMREHLRLVSVDQYELKKEHPDYFNA